jgi:hypothetical protein
MNPIRRIRHFAAALGRLALACLGLAVAAPAAFAALICAEPQAIAPEQPVRAARGRSSQITLPPTCPQRHGPKPSSRGSTR